MYFFRLKQDVGHGRGKHYSVNFPLKDGIDDESYKQIFSTVQLFDKGSSDCYGSISTWSSGLAMRCRFFSRRSTWLL